MATTPGIAATTDPARQDSAADLNADLQRVYSPVQEDLDEVSDTLRSLAFGHPPFIMEMLEHVLATTGKRVRPAVTLLSSRFHPNDGSKARLMATGVEMLHIATLVHDDTIDNSDFRRGRATISGKWGKSAAVLVGDFMFATSATYVCDTGSIPTMRRFAETIVELSSGELVQMAKAYDASVTREEYFGRIYMKTATLFTTASQSGAMVSGAGEGTVSALRDYGYNLGMAFQIVDDILDFQGTSEETGKPVGSDLAHGVMTLPTIIALERSGDGNPVVEYCRQPDDGERLEQAVNFIRQPDIIEEAYSVADDFSRKALQALEPLPPTTARDSLAELVPLIARRRI